MMKKASYILIAAGILLMLFPYIREWYSDWRQKELLREADSVLTSMKQESLSLEAEEAYQRLSRLFMQDIPGQTERDGAGGDQGHNDNESASTDPQQAGTKLIPDKATAVLSIDKIGLRLPVLEGATEANMQVAAAHMKETAPLGEAGNAAIAAHRARTKGRLFNRLNELETGDKLTVEQRSGMVTYTVFQVLRVEPTDVSVLQANGKDKILTLITCDPVVNATHRLIVQARAD
jgi:sortase A